MNEGQLRVAVHPGSAELFLAAEDAHELAVIARTPRNRVTPQQDATFREHPLRALACIDPDYLDQVESWLRGLARSAYKNPPSEEPVQ